MHESSVDAAGSNAKDAAEIEVIDILSDDDGAISIPAAAIHTDKKG